MTLVMVAMNQHFAVQVSDRRLTTKTAVVAEEYAKSVLVQTPTGRMMIAFTGIATTPNRSFSAHEWIQQALADVSYGCHSDYEMVMRFKDAANSFFHSSPKLARIALDQRRLEVCFSGYRYVDNKPHGIFATVSNLRTPDGRFDANFQSGDAPFQFLTMIGARHRPKAAILSVARDILRRLDKAEPMIDFLGDYIQSFAEAGGALSTVGKSLDWLTVYADPARTPVSGYRSGDVKAETYMSDLLVLGAQGPLASARNLSLTATHPLAVPNVHRNAPCPCGSGKRYRDCHRSRPQGVSV